LETIKMYFNRGMDNKLIYSNSGCYSMPTRNGLLIYQKNMKKSYMYIAKWKKPIRLHICIILRKGILEKENYPGNKNIQCLPVEGREEWRDGTGTQGIFRAMKLFWMILQWWIHGIIHLPKPMECMTQRVIPKANFS
jgi:hypothetical protein